MNRYREMYNELLTEKFMLMNLKRDSHMQMQLNVITLKLIRLYQLETNEAKTQFSQPQTKSVVSEIDYYYYQL